MPSRVEEEEEELDWCLDWTHALFRFSIEWFDVELCSPLRPSLFQLRWGFPEPPGSEPIPMQLMSKQKLSSQSCFPVLHLVPWYYD